MADKIKLGEISKNLKITNKDIITKLAEFGVELKSSASVVDEETIGLIFDIYTEMNQVSEEEIREMREAALKKAREDGNDEEKPAKKPAKKTEEKAEKPGGFSGSGASGTGDSGGRCGDRRGWRA